MIQPSANIQCHDTCHMNSNTTNKNKTFFGVYLVGVSVVRYHFSYNRLGGYEDSRSCLQCYVYYLVDVTGWNTVLP